MHCKPTASDPKQILEQEKGTITINYTLLTKELGVLMTHPNNCQQTGAIDSRTLSLTPGTGMGIGNIQVTIIIITFSHRY